MESDVGVDLVHGSAFEVEVLVGRNRPHAELTEGACLEQGGVRSQVRVCQRWLCEIAPLGASWWLHSEDKHGRKSWLLPAVCIHLFRG